MALEALLTAEQRALIEETIAAQKRTLVARMVKDAARDVLSSLLSEVSMGASIDEAIDQLRASKKYKQIKDLEFELLFRVPTGPTKPTRNASQGEVDVVLQALQTLPFGSGSFGDIERLAKNQPKQSIRAALGALVANGLVVKTGQKRSTRYSLKK